MDKTTVINKMDELYKGCLTYERHKEDPGLYHQCIGRLREDINCPCMTCLIKMMCDTICDKLRDKDWWYKPGQDPYICEELI
jgi:hypothetical protein